MQVLNIEETSILMMFFTEGIKMNRVIVMEFILIVVVGIGIWMSRTKISHLFLLCVWNCVQSFISRPAETSVIGRD